MTPKEIFHWLMGELRVQEEELEYSQGLVHLLKEDTSSGQTPKPQFPMTPNWRASHFPRPIFSNNNTKEEKGEIIRGVSQWGGEGRIRWSLRISGKRVQQGGEGVHHWSVPPHTIHNSLPMSVVRRRSPSRPPKPTPSVKGGVVGPGK